MTITVENIAEQGELRLRRIAKVPKAAVEKNATNGHHIAGHSETGHHHTVEARAARFFEDGDDPLTCYLTVTAEYADLVHQRSFDTHKSLRLPKGNWKIRRQREWTPEGWRRALD